MAMQTDLIAYHDRQLTRRAVLQNAYDRVVDARLNGVGALSFSLPADDEKAALPQPLHFVRLGEDGDFYRLTACGKARAATGACRFEAEHAIATLVDDVLFRAHVIGGAGMRTRDVIEYILLHQTVKHWRLDACELDAPHEYAFESENLLAALFSVPTLFAEPYRWQWDMRAYPWRLSLRKISASAPFFVHAGRNLIEENTAHSGASVCTRLHLLGYGEGENQLTIAPVNGGKTYLQSGQALIDRYGLITRVHVDRSVEDAHSLLERGRVLLAQLERPQASRTLQVADLRALSGQDFDAAKPGDAVRMEDDDALAYLTRVTRNLDVDGDMQLTLSTQPHDLADDLADLAARQRVEQLHPQGATQAMSQTVRENATPDIPAELWLMIPRQMRVVNRVQAKIALERFRGTSRATEAAGDGTATSGRAGGGAVTARAAGGGAVVTAAGGGAVVRAAAQRTASGGGTTDGPNARVTGAADTAYGTATGRASGTTASASASMTGSAAAGRTTSVSGSTASASSISTGSASGGGAHTHTMLHTHGVSAHQHEILGGHSHSMLHTHGLGEHTHPVGGHRHGMDHTHAYRHDHTVPGHDHTLPAHSHTVTLAAHGHAVQLPDHAHGVTLKAHKHAVEQGIFRTGSPRTARIAVDGTVKLEMGQEREIDLARYLAGENGQIPRDRWIRIAVYPDDLAYVTVSVVVQGFFQTRGSGLA